jgi:hypothetical protein
VPGVPGEPDFEIQPGFVEDLTLFDRGAAHD